MSRLPRSKRKPTSLAQEVVVEISQLIRNGTLSPGEKLPTEAEIMRSQGVSRTVVREAISRLLAAGLVETRHGIGTFVLAPGSERALRIDASMIVTIRDVLAMLEVRISLESEAAGLAASRRTDEQLREMRRALDTLQAKLAEAGDTVAPDFQFHLQVAYATGNPYFVDVMRHFGTALIPRTRLNTAQLARNRSDQYLKRMNREHEDIYDAIARRDADAARAAMRMHLTNSRERLRAANRAADSSAR